MGAGFCGTHYSALCLLLRSTTCIVGRRYKVATTGKGAVSIALCSLLALELNGRAIRVSCQRRLKCHGPLIKLPLLWSRPLCSAVQSKTCKWAARLTSEARAHDLKSTRRCHACKPCWPSNCEDQGRRNVRRFLWRFMTNVEIQLAVIMQRLDIKIAQVALTRPCRAEFAFAFGA